mmetsp:Transcript_5739/g.14301  ORF Transcript_5739/g.14301 Transcript_5739/m.14301 type:complete len:834 (-) Transcript_5739:72-2573(-)
MVIAEPFDAERTPTPTTIRQRQALLHGRGGLADLVLHEDDQIFKLGEVRASIGKQPQTAVDPQAADRLSTWPRNDKELSLASTSRPLSPSEDMMSRYRDDCCHSDAGISVLSSSIGEDQLLSMLDSLAKGIRSTPPSTRRRDAPRSTEWQPQPECCYDAPGADHRHAASGAPVDRAIDRPGSGVHVSAVSAGAGHVTFAATVASAVSVASVATTAAPITSVTAAATSAYANCASGFVGAAAARPTTSPTPSSWTCWPEDRAANLPGAARGFAAEDDGGDDPASMESVREAIAAMRQRIREDSAVQQELATRLSRELEQICGRTELMSQKHDIIYDRLRSHEEVMADKLRDASDLEREARERLEGERCACDRLRTSLVNDICRLREKVAELEDQIAEVGEVEASLGKQRQAADDSQASLQAELEEVRREAQRVSMAQVHDNLEGDEQGAGGQNLIAPSEKEGVLCRDVIDGPVDLQLDRLEPALLEEQCRRLSERVAELSKDLQLEHVAKSHTDGLLKDVEACIAQSEINLEDVRLPGGGVLSPALSSPEEAPTESAVEATRLVREAGLVFDTMREAEARLQRVLEDRRPLQDALHESREELETFRNHFEEKMTEEREQDALLTEQMAVVSSLRGELVTAKAEVVREGQVVQKEQAHVRAEVERTRVLLGQHRQELATMRSSKRKPRFLCCLRRKPPPPPVDRRKQQRPRASSANARSGGVDKSKCAREQSSKLGQSSGGGAEVTPASPTKMDEIRLSFEETSESCPRRQSAAALPQVERSDEQPRTHSESGQLTDEQPHKVDTGRSPLLDALSEDRAEPAPRSTSAVSAMDIG